VEIEAVDMRRKYAGKPALSPRANRTKLSETRVIDNMEVAQLLKEDTLAKEKEKQRKIEAKLPKLKQRLLRGLLPHVELGVVRVVRVVGVGLAYSEKVSSGEES
jgi:hypothetical protein